MWGWMNKRGDVLFRNGEGTNKKMRAVGWGAGMNRRGDVPTLILFLVAIAFSVFALLAFASFSGGFGDRSRGLSEMMSEVSFAESYVLKEAEIIGAETIKSCLDCSADELKAKFIEVAASRDLGYSGAGNFFGEIRNGKFSFSEEGVLKFDGEIFVGAEREGNEVKREFRLEKRFEIVSN